MIEKLSIGKRRMHIHTSGWHTFYFITFCFLTVTRWHRRRSGQRWHSGQSCRRFWWMYAGSFVPPACQRILCCAIWAWKAAVRMSFINHCQVFFYRSLHLFVPRELNSSLLLFSDVGARCLDQLLRFLYCGV